MAERLFRAIGREDLIDDPRFRTNADRVRNNDELDPIVAGFMASRPREEILEFFERADITVGPVSDVADLVEDPLVRERAVLASYPDADMGTLPMHAPGARLSRTPARMRRPAPMLGEHNAEIYGELGLDSAALARHADDGVI
jgi:formyl-CoA transferase